MFWGYFPAYDWVAFVWLFGSLDEMPFHSPQLCLEIKQWARAPGTTRCMTRDGRGKPGSVVGEGQWNGNASRRIGGGRCGAGLASPARAFPHDGGVSAPELYWVGVPSSFRKPRRS